jgi:hypothetical protein
LTYRILSLDGGGAWALIQVLALMDLFGEDKTGHEVLNSFDLVAANSGGSIVLGGLVEDLPLKTLFSFFKDETKRRSIFSPAPFFDRAFNDITGLGPKYSADRKLPALQTLMPNRGNLPLPNATSGIKSQGSPDDVHLLIVGFDYDRNRGNFFRSANSTGAAQITLAEAIHASSNAPVNYFDGPATFPDLDVRYWDGGISGFNNPILAAVTEAIVRGQSPTDIAALSIGTGTVALPWPSAGQENTPFVQKRSDGGLASDLRKLATAILDDPPDTGSFIAHVMTGKGIGVHSPAVSRIVRLNPLISPVLSSTNSWVPPSPMTAAQLKALLDLDMDAVAQIDVDLIEMFARLWLADKAINQPIRMDRDQLKTELGAAVFSQAKAQWLAIR